jgi:hypothetical protein
MLAKMDCRAKQGERNAPSRLPALFLLSFIGVSRAYACASAPPNGTSVALQDEQVLIVWDAKNHTEHFIRRA